MKLIRPKTPRKLLTRPKTPYYKHKNYINRLNQLVEETARRKLVQLDTDKTQWTWYTGQNLGFLQQQQAAQLKPSQEKDENLEKGYDTELMETESEESESNCSEKSLMESVEEEGEGEEIGALSRKRNSNHAIKSFVKRAKVNFDVADQESEEKICSVPSRGNDPFGISLDLDRAVGTLTDLYNSLSARETIEQEEIKKCRVFKFKNVNLPKLSDEPMKPFDGEEMMHIAEESDPLCKISTSERLGPRFKSRIVREHQKQHISLVPDLRDLRPTVRKSHWLGYHTSVFR